MAGCERTTRVREKEGRVNEKFIIEIKNKAVEEETKFLERKVS